MTNPIELERIRAPDGKLYGVSWNDSDGVVYVRRIGGFGVDSSLKKAGKASNAREAMAKAEAWIYMQR